MKLMHKEQNVYFLVNRKIIIKGDRDQYLNFTYNQNIRFTNSHCCFVDYFEEISSVLQLYQHYTKNEKGDLDCCEFMSSPHNTKITEHKKVKAELLE